MIIESEIRSRVEFSALDKGEAFIHLGYLCMKIMDCSCINLSTGDIFTISEDFLVVPVGNITKVSTL